jgi:Tfp pilus assembly protein PilF
VLDSLLQLAKDDGDVEEVGRLLTLVPDDATNDPGFWRFRGWYAMQTGDLDQADDAFRQALELNPLGWQTRNEYAGLLRLRGQISEATAMQGISSLGSELALEARRLVHAHDISQELLKKMANFALKCNSPDVANGIVRRQRMPQQ